MTPRSQKITLTNNRETPINTKPIAACCKILKPFLYLASSPAAVTIWKPPRSKITKAINANIPNNQLMKFLMMSISLPPCNCSVPDTHIPPAEVASPNHVGVDCARVNKLPTLSIPNTNTDKIFADSFLICFFL